MTLAIPIHLIYQSDNFVVVSGAVGESLIFEIIQPPANIEVCLTGKIAELFQAQCEAWQADHPEEEEVEHYLDRMCSLGQLPMVGH